MKLRRNPFPQQWDEVMCYLSLGLLLPIVFIYDILIVLPAIHIPGSLPYLFTLATGIFVILNLEGNLLATMMIDTSVDPERIEMPPEGSEERLNWRQCTICDRLAPPRSWHCTECGVCILKRDHHCSFTGCCIGHQNHRYFMCFLLYLLVESFFALIYCSIYMWVLNGSEFWKVMLRRPALRFPINDFGIKVQMFLYTLHILAFISPLGALGHYIPLVVRGEVCAEKGNEHSYDNGLIANLRSIFGQRMHLVWLSPLVKSELPVNGYTWNSVSKSKKKTEL